MMTVRQLVTSLLANVDDLDRVISVTTGSEQEPGWSDFVVGCVDFETGSEFPELQCVPRP